MDRIIWLARYEGYFRMLCQGIRNGDEQCIKQSAKFFDAMLPSNSVIVPMPGHKGKATTMLQVAEEIVKLRPDIEMFDVLRCVPHESNYAQKKDYGFIPKPITMVCNDFVLRVSPDGKPRQTFIIDNVVVTGVTAQAAMDALRWPVLCLCKDMWR